MVTFRVVYTIDIQKNTHSTDRRKPRWAEPNTVINGETRFRFELNIEISSVVYLLCLIRWFQSVVLGTRHERMYPGCRSETN